MDKKQIEEMIDLAVRQLDYSYAPYSNFHVGAALLAKNGTCRMLSSGTDVLSGTAFLV